MNNNNKRLMATEFLDNKEDRIDTIYTFLKGARIILELNKNLNFQLDFQVLVL